MSDVTNEDAGAKDDGWIGPVRGLIRVEMFKRSLNYAGLSTALDRIGIKENERNLRNKIARGTFSATFFIQCMVAMGVTGIPLDESLYPNPNRPRSPRYRGEGKSVEEILSEKKIGDA